MGINFLPSKETLDLPQTKIVTLQYQIYTTLNKFSEKNKILGRLCSMPVSIFDVTLHTFLHPVYVIRAVALAAINLIGATFSTEYTLKNALIHTEFALMSATTIPVTIAAAPVKIIFQIFAIIINPQKVQSINGNNSIFEEARSAKKTIKDLQDKLYSKVNEFSEKNKILGRLCSMPLSILDVTLDTFALPLQLIESVYMAAMNLFKAAFFRGNKLKNALIHTESALRSARAIPVTIAVAPVKIIFQIFAIIINPQKVQSINNGNPTFKKDQN